MAFEGLIYNPAGSICLPVYHMTLPRSAPLFCGDPCDLYRKAGPQLMCLSSLGLLPPRPWGGKEGSCIRKSTQADVGPVPGCHRDGDEVVTEGHCSSAEPAWAMGGEGAELGCWGATAKLVEERSSRAEASKL